MGFDSSFFKCLAERSERGFSTPFENSSVCLTEEFLMTMAKYVIPAAIVLAILAFILQEMTAPAKEPDSRPALALD